MENIIGTKIRKLRESASMSQEELAKKTFTSVTDIKLIEEGNETPSLTVISKISNVFSVRLGTILDGAESLTPIITKELGSLHNADKKPTNEDKHLFLSLAKGKADRNMDPYVISLYYSEPTKEVSFSTHEGEEFIYVLDGNLIINYGGQLIELASGDSIYYDAIVPHHLSSKDSDVVTKVLAIKYIP